jgi:hypothetical protein
VKGDPIAHAELWFLVGGPGLPTAPTVCHQAALVHRAHPWAARYRVSGICTAGHAVTTDACTYCRVRLVDPPAPVHADCWYCLTGDDPACSQVAMSGTVLELMPGA